MQYMNFITRSLAKAAAIANKRFGKVSGTAKAGDNNQVLTQTDLEIGQMLIQEVQNRHPDHNIIDEEAGVIDKGSDYTWVIDPIDGTSNFAAGVPNYGIMLGLLEKDRPIAGGVALPYFGEIYAAERNQGTFCNGQPIKVSAEKNLLSSLAVYQLNGYKDTPEITRWECDMLAEVAINIRNLRTTNSVLDIMMVAAGKYGGCLNHSSKIWDNVAQQIIVEEAGGIYTDFWGKPMDYSDPLHKADQNFTFCCASPVLHQQLQTIIQPFAMMNHQRKAGGFYHAGSKPARSISAG